MYDKKGFYMSNGEGTKLIRKIQGRLFNTLKQAKAPGYLDNSFNWFLLY